MLYPIILSGGLGKRLWPISRQSSPKQFQKFFNDKTLLQNTYDRLLTFFDKQHIFVVSNKNDLDTIKEQIDLVVDNFILEPQAKGTAAAIGLAALRLSLLDEKANLLIVNSDHYIKDNKKYVELIKKAESLLDDKYNDKFILAGIKPSYPETGYGYIKLGDKLADDLYLVDSFVEKPDLDKAKEYLADDKFLWNPAIFLFSATKLLEWYKQYMPELYQILMAIKKDYNQNNIDKNYQKIENTSIDYGLLEKMHDMIVIPTDMNWADIGHWRSIRDMNIDKDNKNVSNTKHIGIDSQNNLFYSSSDKLIAAIGVENMILVETEKAILLCPADRAQDVKKILDKMDKEDL